MSAYYLEALEPGVVRTEPLNSGMRMWDCEVCIIVRRIPNITYVLVKRVTTGETFEHTLESGLRKAREWGACDDLVMLARATYAHLTRV